MMLWDLWKKGFDAWEEATARYLEAVLKSSAVLIPSGALLSAVMKAKAERDRMITHFWNAMGLPSRQDQERALHLLNQLHSRINDLEQKLNERSP
ncbi:MAG: poly(R)-hydroxyalkanoic acid synthase subunit PhaE [Myxococcales bacterium]|nr:hypothetical protein [Polyangiaceae bacterium]MDW8248845.1 poly(R)-hydroxyalkanoic acid synthase subunit PhaE [Myxococcales bacterium]